MRELDVHLSVTSTLSSQEYETVMSDGPRLARAREFLRATGRFVRAPRDPDGLLLIHRLLFLAEIPRLDPPPSLDIYDFDDALFTTPGGSGTSAATLLKREASRWRRYVGRSRLVLAGNTYLASAAKDHATGRVEVVPSCVEPADYTRREHEDRDVVTVGWIGSETTATYLPPVIEAMERLQGSPGLPAIRLVVVGARVSHTAPWLECRAWDESRQYAELAEFDIGVMPLPDDAWTRGKCGYKLLQYFAAGVPAVTSPVGVASAMVAEGRGLTAITVAEWERAITGLASDSGERRQRSELCRSYVESEYSYECWAPGLAGLIGEL